MLKEFREFALKGNAVDLAIGVIIGAAFGTVVTSMVNDILMPPIGKVLGGVDFSNFFVVLGGGQYPSLKVAKDAGAATIDVVVLALATAMCGLSGLLALQKVRTADPADLF